MLMVNELNLRTGLENFPRTAGSDATSLRTELLTARRRVDELEFQVEKFRAERDRWQRQADSLERKLLNATARPRLGFSPDFFANLFGISAILVAAAAAVMIS